MNLILFQTTVYKKGIHCACSLHVSRIKLILIIAAKEQLLSSKITCAIFINLEFYDFTYYSSKVQKDISCKNFFINTDYYTCFFILYIICTNWKKLMKMNAINVITSQPLIE